MNIIDDRGFARQRSSSALPWIKVADDAPYFVTEHGDAWTPVGANEGIDWIDLKGLFRRHDVESVERYLCALRDSGVTCLRLMLEDAHVRHRYIEKPVGRFVPSMVTLWDDLFALCERCGLRLLLTPFDTFWAWLHWRHHPYNTRNGGVVDEPSQWLSDRRFREAIKNRLAFAVRRWGGSGALFAWDLWNEIHPAHDGERADGFNAFIADLSSHVRALEIDLYGRSHPQTVSVFGPELQRADMDIAGPLFRHAALDFATIHIYEKGTIDDPRDTVAPTLAMGRIVRESLAQIEDGRPFLDSEHGPIHGFKDRKITLPEAFDDECFRHMQWAHLASGGAGGGMRWPYRHPHRLTPGMRDAQHALVGFCDLVDWTQFKRRPIDAAGYDEAEIAVFACADERQAVLWCLRRGALGRNGMVRRDVEAISFTLTLEGFAPGDRVAMFYDTAKGAVVGSQSIAVDKDFRLVIEVSDMIADIAIAISSGEKPPKTPLL